MSTLRRFLRGNWRGLIGAAFLGLAVNILMPDAPYWRYVAGGIFLLWGIECLAAQRFRDEAPHA